MKRTIFTLLMIVGIVVSAELPEKKQTELGLYVTAQQAFAMWHQDKEAVHIVDVRTPAEYIFIGHASMAQNIPLKFLADECKDRKMLLLPNSNFVDAVKARYKKSDKLILYWRYGGRSAAAVNALAAAGYKNVYSMTDGFEGDALKDENSYNNGKRILNGWKNSSAPWTYKLDPELVY